MKERKNNRKMKGSEPIFIDKKSKIGILLLHGFTSTPYQFKEMADFISSKGITVYAPLIAGHGTSPDDLMKTSPLDWTQSVKEAFLKLKSKTEKVFIGGNSFGGNLAFWLAKEFNNSPAGIISLGTPIFLRFQWFIKLRYYLYGWAKKYYKKTLKMYRIDYTDMLDEITYPVIPVKSIMDFLHFIKSETIPNLKNIKVPTLVLHANKDPVVSPKSAVYIYQNLSSRHKLIYFFSDNSHSIFNKDLRRELYQKIFDFIRKIN